LSYDRNIGPLERQPRSSYLQSLVVFTFLPLFLLFRPFHFSSPLYLKADISRSGLALNDKSAARSRDTPTKNMLGPIQYTSCPQFFAEILLVNQLPVVAEKLLNAQLQLK
jgi:hypothetical protein